MNRIIEVARSGARVKAKVRFKVALAQAQAYYASSESRDSRGRPKPPTAEQVGRSYGLEPGTYGWRADVKRRRQSGSHSAIEVAYDESLGKWEAANPSLANPEKARYEAAGMGHLWGARIVTSSRGTCGAIWGGGGNTASALTAKECMFLGRTPGPGNA